jgi:hypothetical protein
MAVQDFSRILSGDGDSPATAILFERCDLKTRKIAERHYISKRFGKEGIDWTSGIHITTTPGLDPSGANALSDLFRKAYEEFDGSDKKNESIGKNSKTDETELPDSEIHGLFSQWNIDLRDGTAKRIFFATSNTIYDE